MPEETSPSLSDYNTRMPLMQFKDKTRSEQRVTNSQEGRTIGEQRFDKLSGQVAETMRAFLHGSFLRGDKLRGLIHGQRNARATSAYRITKSRCEISFQFLLSEWETNVFGPELDKENFNIIGKVRCDF